ncbi:MAG: T9SS type A sorting domain-containing protein, partial [Chitinophagaceae bacterium]|nr:T9SS type A sorting domain-containing protein [Chitinophagaceae bacterium]
FVVEKSFDGNSFTQLGSIEAKNNVSINEYSLLDAAILERITYYRLKQIDKNGKFSYSNIVSVNPATIAKNTVAVYPNPIVGSIMNIGLQSTQNTKAALMITDVTGRIVLHQQSSIIKGSQLIQVDVSRLSTGTYYLTVLFNNEKITQKISK